MKIVFAGTTHVHGDHTAGMVQLISLMNRYYKESSGRFFITRQNHIDATLRWLETSESGAFAYDRLHLEVPKAGVVYEDENIKAEYIPNDDIEAIKGKYSFEVMTPNDGDVLEIL